MDLKRRTDVNKSGLNTFGESDATDDIAAPMPEIPRAMLKGEKGTGEPVVTVARTKTNTTTVGGGGGGGLGGGRSTGTGGKGWARRNWIETMRVLKKYAAFVGPGFMISVSYMDPGNYSTDVGSLITL